MTEGSVDSLSGQRYNATCPWNPVPSISFVFSIHHDQLSFLFSCSFIRYLMEGLPTWKTWPLCLSSQWHHPSGYTCELLSLKWNAVYIYFLKICVSALLLKWTSSKALLKDKDSETHQGAWSFWTYNKLQTESSQILICNTALVLIQKSVLQLIAHRSLSADVGSK